MAKVLFFPMNQVPQSVVDQIVKDSKDPKLENYGVFDEQLCYFRKPPKESFFFACFDEEECYIGGVALFLADCYALSDLGPPCIQGISKSKLDSPIKINSFLIPAVISFLKERGYCYVHVLPYERQSRILRTYYNFQTIDGFEDLLVCHF